MKKILFFAITATFLSLIVVIQSCDQAEDPNQDPLVGKYIISSAVLSEPLTLGDTVLASETNLTIAINAALLTDAGCNDMANTRLELKDGGEIWYVCVGEDIGFANGTWEVNDDRTVLSLALNIIQGSTSVTIPLNITDLDEGTLNVSGNTQIPLPPEFFLALGIDVTGSGVPIYQTKIHIEITRTL